MYKVNINFFLKNFGYGRDYIYAGEKSALVKFASLSQEKELADYDDLWYVDLLIDHFSLIHLSVSTFYCHAVN